MKFQNIILIFIIFGLVSFKSNNNSLIVYNAKIYTLDDSNFTCSAMAIQNGRFIATGTDSFICNTYKNIKTKINANQKIIYPGFIDAHAHFTGNALDYNKLQLFGTKSFEEVIKKIKIYQLKNKSSWILGRGWNQNDWENKNFPTNDSLNKYFPNIPIYLLRIDGHAALCNNKALEVASINASTKIFGGEVVLKNGKPTGLLIDNAMQLVEKILPKPSMPEAIKLFNITQKYVFENGVTSIVDCGVTDEIVGYLKKAYQTNQLQLSLAIMLSNDSINYAKYLNQKPYTDEWLKIIGYKIYADGALGSRGAYLINPYSDNENNYGLLLTPVDSLESIAKKIYQSKYQMCTHAIGDAGNKIVLNTYKNVLPKMNDRRWRIEHAQVVNENDIAIFGDYKIIPSVQPTHATSDMPWALDRLGNKRIANAYCYQKLLQQNNWLPLGTDFPVEYLNPFHTFYSAVFRIYDSTKPAFQTQDALTRLQALKGITTWAAQSSFEEMEKGKIKIGMRADFIICNTDILNAPALDCKNAKVLQTYVKGNCVWKRGK